jgi:hypothetical protein
MRKERPTNSRRKRHARPDAKADKPLILGARLIASLRRKRERPAARVDASLASK